jgi:hypothetical protein
MFLILDFLLLQVQPSQPSQPLQTQLKPMVELNVMISKQKAIDAIDAIQKVGIKIGMPEDLINKFIDELKNLMYQ